MVVGEATLDTDVLVIGSGPGGYAAAFRAADLGLDVTMVSMEDRPGGVCLHVGCIPSKALLHLAHLLDGARSATEMGITFGKPEIDLAAIRSWKDQVISKLTGGLAQLSQKRDVQLLRAQAVFEASDRVRLEGSDTRYIRFKHAILATGSRPIPLPGAEFRPGSRIMDSTEALALQDIPEKLLVVGGGYIGLELGSVYAALGSSVTLVEMTDRLLPGTDRDLIKPLARQTEKLFAATHLNTRVSHLDEQVDHVEVTLEGEVDERQQSFDRVLVAIGRRPNSNDLGLEHTTVKLDERGYVVVDETQRTTDSKILAIGDVVGGAMLAHKAMREGKVAAEVIAGQPSAFDAQAIPAVVFTDPQVAWCGLTEEQAQQQGRAVKVARFPWGASGRAATMGVSDGLTKLLLDPETQRVLGVGIVGSGAGEMIAEGVLAVEMAALADDVALSIHPHPTLSETIAESAEVFLGSATHFVASKR